MRIRKSYQIKDRLKILLFLLFLLAILGNLARIVHDNSRKIQMATIEMLLKTALKPVGSTMYIWGGGWDEEELQAGKGSTKIGLSPEWKRFAEKQDEMYDFTKHRFERENGLDCSGYVGWVIYNTFETESGKSGYVTFSTDMARDFANRGWGEFINNSKEFKPGDIVSMEGHVWICLGTCADGSVLLAHSSPPGVSVCGTYVKKGEESIAITLATEYMRKNHPNWQEKYPNRIVSKSYLENVSLMRWNSDTMSDAKKMQGLSGEEIMQIITPDM